MTKFIPLSKSVANRLMLLSIRDKDYTYLNFLENYEDGLPNDINVCRMVMRDWDNSDFINVGESRTALIFLQEYAKRNGIKKHWNIEGTLWNRKLENTSQTISARILCGDEVILNDEPYHVKLTRSIMSQWEKGNRESLFTMEDETLWEQCLTMECVALKGLQSHFKIKSAEDVCLAYFLTQCDKMPDDRKVTLEDIVDKFPTTLNHESNRPLELLKTLIEIKNNQEVMSNDHRVVMAASFYAMIKNIKIEFRNPTCVSKSFPKWWKYLELLRKGTGVIIND